MPALTISLRPDAHVVYVCPPSGHVYPKNTKSQGFNVLPLMVSDRRFIDYSRTEIEAQGDEEGKPFPGTDNLILVE